MRIRFLVLLWSLPLATVLSAEDPTSRDVDAVPLARIMEVSGQIDQLVQSRLRSEGQQPNPLADDETFVRRIYLDVAGRIPTLVEVNRFLESDDPQKRSRLIDQLLQSRGYVSHYFNFWADILRAKTQIEGAIAGQPYIDFIKTSLATNMPYDEFVHQMLASEGPYLAAGNGAAGYYLRDRGMPEDNMANTSRIFLGTRLECAQCHDHPFAPWTQRDFFEMVAFTNGIATERGPAHQMRRELRDMQVDSEARGLASNILLQMPYGVYGGGSGRIRLPTNSRSASDVVTAKTLFEKQELVRHVSPIPPDEATPQAAIASSASMNRGGMAMERGGMASRGGGGMTDPTAAMAGMSTARATSAAEGDGSAGARFAFARWLTSPDNPRFTKVIANRMWAQVMGRGLIEPIDDITAETIPSNPELLDFLSDQMIALDYDLKQYLRAVLNSRTYQSVASDAEIAEGQVYHFPGPLLRRMSAEQVWDSIVTLAVPDPDFAGNVRDEASRTSFGEEISEGFEQVKGMSLEELLEFAERELETRRYWKDPDVARKRHERLRRPAERFVLEANDLRSRIEALQLMMRGERGGMRALRLQEIRALTERLSHVPAGTNPYLVRASELRSPAPSYHFLRQFGQSDREEIENSHTEPSISQALTLMNGLTERWILSNSRTALMYHVSIEPDKLEAVYLGMLSRRPTVEEKQSWIQLGDQVGDEAIEDLIWTLANTSEFLFVR